MTEQPDGQGALEMNEMYSIRKVRTTLTVQTPDEPDTWEIGDGLLVCGRYVINFIEEPV